jgi:hypothetical protein
MSSTLAEVPDDVLFKICRFLAPQYLLSFYRTSRRNHAFVRFNVRSLQSHWRASLECKVDFDAFLVANGKNGFTEMRDYFNAYRLYEDFVTMAEDVIEFWESPERERYPDLQDDFAIFMPSFHTALSASLRFWSLYKYREARWFRYEWADSSTYPPFVEFVWKEYKAKDIADICTVCAMFGIWCRLTANECESQLCNLVEDIDLVLRVSNIFKGIFRIVQPRI